MPSIELEIFVDDIDGAMASYDVVRVQRSTTGIGGAYSEITAATAQKATLLGTAHSPFNVVGQNLILEVNHGATIGLTFAGTNPLQIGSVVSQINAVFTSLASDESSHLRLQSTITGTASKIKVVGGTAAVTLGFTALQQSVGKDPYVSLQALTSTYWYYDNDGEDTYYYKVAYYHKTTGVLSPWSDPFKGASETVLDSSKLSVGTIHLVDAEGKAVSDQEIVFYSINDPTVISGNQVGMIRDPLTITTDDSGYAGVSLVRGLKVKVVFSGTSVIREITIPDTSTFDLMTLISTAPDPFNPIAPDYPWAIRRTL